MPRKITKQQKKEIFDCMLEHSIMYWLDMLPPMICKKYMEINKHNDWYYPLDIAFGGGDNPKFNTLAPSTIKLFLIEFIDKSEWKATMFKDLFEQFYEGIKADFYLQKRDINMTLAFGLLNV